MLRSIRFALVGTVALAALLGATAALSNMASIGSDLALGWRLGVRASMRGWHVAIAAIPLLVLGEAALILPAIVWWVSRRIAA
jgi:hypothetical protein